MPALRSAYLLPIDIYCCNGKAGILSFLTLCAGLVRVFILSPNVYELYQQEQLL